MGSIFAWFAIVVAVLTVFCIVCLALEQLRARLTRPPTEGPLSGMTIGQTVLAAGYVLPILVAGYFAIHNVLT